MSDHDDFRWRRFGELSDCWYCGETHVLTMADPFSMKPACRTCWELIAWGGDEDEVRTSDPLNPPGPGDETASHVYPKSGMVLDQEALLDGTGRWGELPYKSRGVHHPVEGWE